MIQSTTNQNPLSAADPISPRKSTKKGEKGEEKAGFKSSLDGRVAALAALLQAQPHGQTQAVTNPKVRPNVNLESEAMGSPALLQERGQTIERPGKDLMARMDSADYSPKTARISSSVNAGSSIAGLKPWNQDWVFEGNPNPQEANGNVKPLFGPSNREIELAEMKEALQQLRHEAGSPNSRLQSMRGNQDTAAQLAPNAKVAAQASPAERMHMAQVNGALAANLAHQLRSMNGQISEIQGNPKTSRAGQPKRFALINGQASGSGLSGADFLSARQTVRPNPASSAEREGDFLGQNKSGLENRPEFKVTDGMKSGHHSNAFAMDAQGAVPPSVLGLSAMHSAHSPQPFALHRPVAQVTGHVVQGAMAQDRLSHESLLGMTNGIRNMAAQNGGLGGGEMRIRLKPDNLGELHLKVQTRGHEVGLQIQASDEKAKKILQDSLGSLKDSLAQQSLTLGKVEFSVAQASAGHGAHGDLSNQQQQQRGSQQQQYFQSALGQNSGDNRNQNRAQWNSPESDSFGARPFRAAVQASNAGSSARVASGRLDVRA